MSDLGRFTIGGSMPRGSFVKQRYYIARGQEWYVKIARVKTIGLGMVKMCFTV